MTSSPNVQATTVVFCRDDNKREGQQISLIWCEGHTEADGRQGSRAGRASTSQSCPPWRAGSDKTSSAQGGLVYIHITTILVSQKFHGAPYQSTIKTIKCQTQTFYKISLMLLHYLCCLCHSKIILLPMPRYPLLCQWYKVAPMFVIIYWSSNFNRKHFLARSCNTNI